MSVTAASLSALLLLSLAGGYIFSSWCLLTRYPSRRGDGQELYFFAVVFAVVLVMVARVVIVAEQFMPAAFRGSSFELWRVLAGPLYSEYLATFFIAFCLGPICALIINGFVNYRKFSRKLIEEYGGELEKFLYYSVVDRQLIWIALKNGKVYVGWATEVPKPQPRKENSAEHFALLPVRSGFMDDKLEPNITTDYEHVYFKIIARELPDLDIEDFEVVIPLSEIVVVRAYSTNLDQRLFKRNI